MTKTATERADDDDDDDAVEVATIIHTPKKKSKPILVIDLCDSSDDDDYELSQKADGHSRAEHNVEKNMIEVPSPEKSNQEEIIENSINDTEKSVTLDPTHVTSTTTTTTNATTTPLSAIPTIELPTNTHDVNLASSNQTSTSKDHSQKQQQDEISNGRLSPTKLNPGELDLINFFKELDSEVKFGFGDQDLLALGQQLVPTSIDQRNPIGGQEQPGPSSSINSRTKKSPLLKSSRKRKTPQKPSSVSPSNKSLSPHLRRLFVDNVGFTAKISCKMSTLLEKKESDEISETSESMDEGGIGNRSDNNQTVEKGKSPEVDIELPTGIIIFYPKLWNSMKKQELLQFLKKVKTMCHVRLRPQLSKDKSNVRISIRSSSVDSINEAKRIIRRWLDPKLIVKEKMKWPKESKRMSLAPPSDPSTGLVVDALSSASSSNNCDSLNIQKAVECWSLPLPPEYWNYVRAMNVNGHDFGWRWLPQDQRAESSSQKFMDKIVAIVVKYGGSLKQDKLGNTVRFVITGPSAVRARAAKMEIDHCIQSMDKNSEVERERERLKAIEELELEVAELEREKRRLEWEASRLD